MPETEADRLVKAQARQQRQQQKQQEEETLRQARLQEAEHIRKLEMEVPMVLRWLGNHHYPTVVQVHIPTEKTLKKLSKCP